MNLFGSSGKRVPGQFAREKTVSREEREEREERQEWEKYPGNTMPLSFPESRKWVESANFLI